MTTQLEKKPLLTSENLEVEVVEIYPKLQKHRKSDVAEWGSCHVRIEILGADIRNIPYCIKKDGQIRVDKPAVVVFSEEEKIVVPTITFDDRGIWKKILATVKTEIKATCRKEKNK